jgi:tetratricopeptide (TPR) repeat protein
VKPLAILLGAVLFLLTAWWLIGRGFHGPQGPAPLILPSDPRDKPGLIRAAHQLWRATPDYFDPAAVFAFIQRLNDSLDDDQWKAVSSPVFFAWENHRKMVSRRPALTALNVALLPRWIRSGSMSDLEGLIRVANEKSFDSGSIDTVLQTLATAPLPPSGYDGSRFSELAAAAIRIGDFKRAKAYLKMIAWTAGTEEDLKKPAALVADIIELCLLAETGRYNLPAVVQAWDAQGADAIGRTALRPVLEDIALRALRGTENPGASILPLFEASQSVEGADGYWDRVVGRFMPNCLDGNENKISALATLSSAYGARFERPDYAFRLFMKAGPMIEKSSPGDPLRAVRLFEVAAAVAPSDAGLAEATRRAAAGQMKALEFPRARKGVESALAKVKDSEAVKALQALLEEVLKKQKADDDRVAKTRKEIDLNRTQNRLSGYKDRLAAARKAGRPQEELESLQRVIKILEKEITE